MKRVYSIIGIGLLLLAGVSLLLYPGISNWLTEQHQSKAMQQYSADVTKMNAQAIKEERVKAKEYNDSLSGIVVKDPFIPGSGTVLPENYNSILNLNGTIGYIEIPKINVSLPIYHGTGETVLKKGIGHMEMTAFPISGRGSHTVLTGHRGLSSAKLFTDLDQLVIRDVFYLHVLDETLAYEVDQILVVEPDDTSAMLPVADKNYVTLVTCTPYAINSHRLLVRGTNVPYIGDEAVQAELSAKTVNWRIIIIVTFFVFLALTLETYLYVDRRKKRGGR